MSLTTEEILGDGLRHFLHRGCDLRPLVRLDHRDREDWAKEGSTFRAWLDARGVIVRAK